jgi:hypothetical protein
VEAPVLVLHDGFFPPAKENKFLLENVVSLINCGLLSKRKFQPGDKSAVECRLKGLVLELLKRQNGMLKVDELLAMEEFKESELDSLCGKVKRKYVGTLS